MSDQLPIPDYADRRRTRVLPSRNDWAVALFIVIAVFAGMVGVVGLVAMIAEYANAAEPVPISFIVIGLLFYGGALALAWGAVRLANRRARVK